MSYIIFSYPFSQTTWLTSLLREMGSDCRHEKSADFSSLQEFKDFIEENDVGIVDTALCNIHGKLKKYKRAAIVNDICSIRKALKKRSLPINLCDYMIPIMENIFADESVYKIGKEDLVDEKCMRDLCGYLDVPFKKDVFDSYRMKWVTTDFFEFIEKLSKSNKDYSWLLDR